MSGHDIGRIVIAGIGGLLLGSMIQVAVIRIALLHLADDVRRLADRFAPELEDVD